MRGSLRSAPTVALVVALASLGGVGMATAPSAEAQNAAAQRADRLVGSRVLEGRITAVDRAGRIVDVDRRMFLLGDAIALPDIRVGQQVSVTPWAMAAPCSAASGRRVALA